MPFVTQTFFVQPPQKAVKWVQDFLGISNKQAQGIIDKGRVKVGGAKVRKAQILSGAVELTYFKTPQLQNLDSENLDFGGLDSEKLDSESLNSQGLDSESLDSVSGADCADCEISESKILTPIFANEFFCVFDKPHNLLTHPKGAFFHASLIDSLKAHFGASANPAHRLDSQTSGLVLCARDRFSEVQLKDMFLKKQIEKTYTAIVRGIVERDFLEIDAKILNQNNGADLSIRSKVSESGKSALTLLRVLKRDFKKNLTLVELLPKTGRTHQLRVHLEHIGHAILGDFLYGVGDEVSRYFLENASELKNAQKCKQLLGAEHLMLNATTLKFNFKGDDFFFKSSLQPNL